LSALRGEETTTLSCHPHCSIGTYLFVDQDRKATPVTQFVDVGPMLREMDELAARPVRAASSSSPRSKPGTTCASSSTPRKPQDLTFNKFLQTLQGMTDKKYGRGDSEKGASPTAPDAGRHALHGPLQLRRGARQALRDSYAAPTAWCIRSAPTTPAPPSAKRVERQFSIPIETRKRCTAFAPRPSTSAARGRGLPELVG